MEMIRPQQEVSFKLDKLSILHITIYIFPVISETLDNLMSTNSKLQVEIKESNHGSSITATLIH